MPSATSSRLDPPSYSPVSISTPDAPQHASTPYAAAMEAPLATVPHAAPAVEYAAPLRSETPAVEFPAKRYILRAMKAAWRPRVTTVLPDTTASVAPMATGYTSGAGASDTYAAQQAPMIEALAAPK